MKSLHKENLINQFENSRQFLLLITDIGGRFLYTNSLFEIISGYTPQQEHPFFLKDIIAPHETPKYSAIISKCIRHPGIIKAITLLCHKQDGSPFCVRWELSVLLDSHHQPKAIQWIGVEEYTNKQISTGEQLQQSELFYSNLIADSLDGILLTDEKGIINFASASVKKILGYPPEEMLNKKAFDFLHPDDRAAGLTAFYTEVDSQAGFRFINARLLQQSGEWLWCMVRGHNLFSNPYVGAMLIYFCDDTMRKNAETALMESEQLFRHLIHHLNLGVFLLDKDGKILVCNQASLRLLGLREEHFLGTYPLKENWDAIHENGSRFLPSDYPIAISINTKEKVTGAVMGVYRPAYADRIWLLVNSDAVLDNENNLIHVICSFTDITEQKRLSRQLIEQEIQKQKQLMQATIDGQENERKEIGRELHDNISQYLTTTRLFLEVAQDKAEGETLKVLQLAHKGIMDIVTEIRHLSQSLIPPSLSDIGLIASVQDICDPLKNTHAYSIDFQYDQFDELLLPENMKLMLFRIIQEQINNIIRHAQARSIRISLEAGEDRVALVVSDDGKGFDPKTIKKGLGFDNISNRAGLFGGKLRIDTSPGKGCLLEVTIPL